MSKKIVMMVRNGTSATFLYNALKKEFSIRAVIVEEPIHKKKFIQRRIKRLGWIKVIGQVLFQLSIPRILAQSSKKRIQNIEQQYHLEATPIPIEKIVAVKSVNSKACIQFLQETNPDLIIVNGTRIISKKVLNSIPATFVNTHAGITPKYRGVHGGYWAMANRDRENCGVTVHLIDSGIDTGGILSQQRIEPTEQDNFLTYTYLQMGEGIELMKKVVHRFLKDDLVTVEAAHSESQLWYHPTLWFYLFQRIFRGVK